MKKAINKLFGYTCVYEVNDKAGAVLFWVNGRGQIWLGIDDFFDHFTICDDNLS